MNRFREPLFRYVTAGRYLMQAAILAEDGSPRDAALAAVLLLEAIDQLDLARSKMEELARAAQSVGAIHAAPPISVGDFLDELRHVFSPPPPPEPRETEDPTPSEEAHLDADQP